MSRFVLAIIYALTATFTGGFSVSADGTDTPLVDGPWIDFVDVDVTVVRAWDVVPGETMTFVVSVTRDGAPAPVGLLAVTPEYPFAEGAGVSNGSAVAIGDARKFFFTDISGTGYVQIPVPDDVLATGASAVMVATVTYALPVPADPGFPPQWLHGQTTVSLPIVEPRPEGVR